MPSDDITALELLDKYREELQLATEQRLLQSILIDRLTSELDSLKAGVVTEQTYLVATFTQWQGRDYPASDAPFRVAETGGPQPVFHDRLDALRSMWRRTPDAEYPDGYIGTVQTQRRGRLRSESPGRQTNKPYLRGVHVGERVNQDEYFWPQEMQFWDGIKYQESGMRYIPPGVLMDIGEIPQTRPNPTQPYLSRVGARGTPARTGTVNWGSYDPDRASTLRRLAPPWGGGGPGPGMAIPYPGR